MNIYEGTFDNSQSLDRQRGSVMGHEIEHLTEENVELQLKARQRKDKNCDECETEPARIGQKISEGK